MRSSEVVLPGPFLMSPEGQFSTSLDMVSFAAAELMTSSLQNARLHGFEGKGHLPLFTATNEFCEVLRAFVRSVGQRGVRQCG
jgi:hypothetical protein